MQIPTANIDLSGYLSFANLLAIFGIIFGVGRFAEKVSNLEEKVKNCEIEKVQTAVIMVQLEAYKEALDKSTALLEKMLYEKFQSH